MNKIDKIMKKSKPNLKIVKFALKRGAKRHKHYHFNLKKLLRHKNNSKKKTKKPNSVSKVMDTINKSSIKKLNHKQLHTLLNCLARSRKKIARKFKQKDFAMTMLYVFKRYIHTAKGGQKVLIKKELNSKIKSVAKHVKWQG